MASQVLFIACALGATALYLILRPGPRALRALGAILGLAVVGYLIGSIPAALGGDRWPDAFFAIFTVIALAAGVRMITHSRPVYSALYFVLVVLSSAGLFLLLEAEFMAFALVIVYAGAILITYLFVLMLAQQASPHGDVVEAAEYDRVPREPAAGVVVGFIMLAVLGDLIYLRPGDWPAAPRPEEVEGAAWGRLDKLPAHRDALYDEIAPGGEVQTFDGGRTVRYEEGQAFIIVVPEEGGQPLPVQLPEEARPDNAQLVGLALIGEFPVSLELAGVILLLAMFGAVVLARRHIDLTEDEKREAAGMRRRAVEADEREEATDVAGGAPA